MTQLQQHIITPQQFAERAKIMKAMGHPSRLMIIDELSRGSRCVCDLKELVGHDISTVSKHLNILKKAHIVTDTRKGKNIFYSLKIPCILNFFQCVDSVINARNSELLED